MALSANNFYGNAAILAFRVRSWNTGTTVFVRKRTLENIYHQRTPQGRVLDRMVPISKIMIEVAVINTLICLPPS